MDFGLTRKNFLYECLKSDAISESIVFSVL